jgi:hypothetical protein
VKSSQKKARARRAKEYIERVRGLWFSLPHTGGAAALYGFGVVEMLLSVPEEDSEKLLAVFEESVHISMYYGSGFERKLRP